MGNLMARLKNVAPEVVLALHAQGWSQHTLARRYGCSPRTIAKFLRSAQIQCRKTVAFTALRHLAEGLLRRRTALPPVEVQRCGELVLKALALLILGESTNLPAKKGSSRQFSRRRQRGR